jgi:hypothetical protein
MIDPQFAHSAANRFHISEIAERKAANSSGDADDGMLIAEARHPRFEDGGLADFDHGGGWGNDGGLSTKIYIYVLLGGSGVS